MNATLLMILALGGPQAAPAAVPPPPVRTVAECASPIYVVDSLICSDAALLAAEDEIARLVADSDQEAAPGAWAEDQRAWIARRARCAFKEDQRTCIVQANDERRRVLTPMAGSHGSRPAVCREATGVIRPSLATDADAIAGSDAEGRRLFTALPPASDWTPYVRIVSARRMEFRRIDGAILRCRLG